MNQIQAINFYYFTSWSLTCYINASAIVLYEFLLMYFVRWEGDYIFVNLHGVTKFC